MATRIVGHRQSSPTIVATASAEALRTGLAVVDAAATFGWATSTGQRKGVYRFSTFEAMGLMTDRRRLLISLSAAAAGAAGCGFQLRQAPKLPFRSVALVGFAQRSPLADALRQQLGASGVQLLEEPSRSQAVLEALADGREKSVVTSTAAGQVRELQLRVKLRFRVATPAGKLLLAPAELLLTRDMSYSETAALAKAQEEALLYRAMEDDIVAQVLRRLAAIPGL